jgi:hypothetical protein
MDRNGNNPRTPEQENGHLSEDDLLLYADGELARDLSLSAEAHLEACWSCRTRAEKYEETIRSYVDYREAVQKPMDEAPPGGWRKFDHQLGALVVAKGQRSPVSRLRGWLGSLRPSLPNLSFNPQLIARFVAVLVIAAIVIAVVLFKSNQITIVSANELMQRAVEAQTSSIRITSQPVIHQRLQLRRKTQTKEEAIDWETWHDLGNARFAQKCDGCLAVPAEAKSEVSVTDTRHQTPGTLLSTLKAVFAANQMDARRPLSASSYQSWRDSLVQKREEVTRIKLSSGTQALTLRTLASGSINEGQIAEATFTVRAADWHPVEQRLTVKVAGGTEVYELTETQSEVVSLNQVNPAIFGPEPLTASVESKSSPPSSPEASVEADSTAAIASAELEVEVVRLLHQAGADLGEQITVTRTTGGPVRVTGLVETDQRKREIVAAMAPVAGNPGVQIEIQTVAEALAKQKQKSSSSSQQATTSEGVEIQSTGIAAEPELRAYFARRGDNSDTAVRQYAAGRVRQSSQGMQRLGAMMRLINQFSPEQVRKLTPEARDNWLGLLRVHARAYQQQSAALRRDLKPVFFSAASDDLPGVPAMRSDEDLRQAVRELFAAGAANDQVIRSAFTATSGGVRFTAVGTTQFWQALMRAEALAAQISKQ